MQCAICHTDNPPEARFCQNCGNPLVATVEQEKANGTLGPRKLGDIIGDTFKIIVKHFFRLTAIIAIVYVAFFVLMVLLFLPIIIPNMAREMWEINDISDTFFMGYFAYFAVGIVVVVVIGIVGFTLMELALVQAVSEQILGKTIGIWHSYRYALRKFWTLIGAQLLAGLAVLGMAITVVGIPFAIYFGIRWIFIQQAVIVEGVGSGDALSRSSEAVKGDWWRVVGIMIVIVLIAYVVDIVVGIIPIVGSIIGQILWTTITIIGATLLYYDLRVRKQGYSLETLATELSDEFDSGIA